MVSVLHKELERKVEKLKYKKMEVTQQRIKKLVTYSTHKPTDRNCLRRMPNNHELLLPKTAPQSSSFSLSAILPGHTVKFRKYGLIFFKGPFKGRIFGGVYLRREICVLKSIGLALFLERNLPFFFVLHSINFEGYFQVQAPEGGLHLEGRFKGGFFGLRVWGAYIWRGLYMEGLIFGILLYLFYIHFFAGRTWLYLSTEACHYANVRKRNKKRTKAHWSSQKENNTSFSRCSCSWLYIVCTACMYCLHSPSSLFNRAMENVTSILGRGIPGSHKKCCGTKQN